MARILWFPGPYVRGYMEIRSVLTESTEHAGRDIPGLANFG